MTLNLDCLGPCNPKQIVNILIAINDISTISIYHDSIAYDTTELSYAYSIDNLCWSCYMNYSEALKNTVDIQTDFYVRIKVNGKVTGVTYKCEEFLDYKCSIAQEFDFSSCATTQNPNLYNPYMNMDCAIALQQNLAETVACITGIPIYYIKLSGDASSRDLTFKEYTLLNVKDIKQIKMIIQDNQMPSSKPEFSDFGLDWQTDWECEITKGMFATAFGPTVQPMEGDLVYVPMMKRMWMLTGAYEEKKDAFMWCATTFKITLVKYQEKGSVDLGTAQEFVDTLVKNKYDDLFGTDENVGSGEENTPQIQSIPNNLTPVFESDSLRKYASIDNLLFTDTNLYHSNTLVANSNYTYSNTTQEGKIIYQKQYCGEDGVLSFIITPAPSIYETNLLTIGNIIIHANQNNSQTVLTVKGLNNLSITLDAGTTYFIYLRWNRMLNTVSLSAAKYTHRSVPTYMLQNQHYFFDIENSITVSDKYTTELVQTIKTDLEVSCIIGSITNIKLFNKDTDNISEILQMMPTNSNLLINDTARRFVRLNGV